MFINVVVHPRLKGNTNRVIQFHFAVIQPKAGKCRFRLGGQLFIVNEGVVNPRANIWLKSALWREVIDRAQRGRKVFEVGNIQALDVTFARCGMLEGLSSQQLHTPVFSEHILNR